MSNTIIPPAKPKLPAAMVHALANGANNLNITILLPNKKKPVVSVLAIRGYRRDSMGVPGVNDAGIYDDAAFLIVGEDVYPYNFNADPSVIGWNRALGKPFAQLKTGLWYFIRGLHKGKTKAFRQPDEDEAEQYGIPNFGHFTVIRDDGRGHKYEDTGYHAINGHSGSLAGTSSWGCITWPPTEWFDFQETAYAAMKKAQQTVLPVLLIDGPVI